MQEELKQLLDLQKIDSQLDRLNSELNDLPLLIQKKRELIQGIRQEHEVKKKKLLSFQLERKNKEVELASLEEKIRKHEAELNAIKSNEAYKALMREIEGVKKEKGTLEEEILRLFDEADRLNLDLKKEETGLKEDAQKLEQEIAEMETQIQKSGQDLEEKKKGRDAFVAAVNKEIFKVYEYVREKKKGVAIVAIDGECCAGCNTFLTPGTINEVKKGKNLVRCDSCARILFDPQAVSAS